MVSRFFLARAIIRTIRAGHPRHIYQVDIIAGDEYLKLVARMHVSDSEQVHHEVERKNLRTYAVAFVSIFPFYDPILRHPKILFSLLLDGKNTSLPC